MEVPTEEDVKNFYYTFWMAKGCLPSTTEVALAFNANPVVIRNIVDNQKFRDVLVRRGLPLSSKQVLTPEQFKCIAILTDPSIKGNQAARLKLAGVAWNTYKAWMRIPAFKENMTQNAAEILENNLAGINMGLVNAAERGETAAIKFFYEVTGRYDPTEKKAIDVMAVLAQVVEIISEEVTDPVALDRIATRLSLVASKTGIGLGSGPAKTSPQTIQGDYSYATSPVANTFTITPLGELP